MSRKLMTAWSRTLRRYGEKPAVIEADTGTTVSFLDLDERANRWLERHAKNRALLRDSTVVFAVPNGIVWLEIFVGLLKAKAIVVPIDAAEPVASQRKIADALRANFWWDGTQLLALKNSKRARNPLHCLIKLTSGTTGNPKPLRFTGQQLLADARQVTATMRIGPRDFNYAVIPLGHSYGLGNLTLPLLAHGVPLVCGSSPLPHAIAADFARWKPTVFPGVPAMWRALAAADLELKSLRTGISAGAALPPEVAHDFEKRFGQRLHNFYGSSETGGIAYDATGQATLDGGVGKALRGVKLTASDGDRLKVESAAVFTHGNRQRNRKQGTWTMTDRGGLDARGNVTLLGRRGQIVKISGRRINLAEVTSRLRQIAGVSDAWVGITPGNDSLLGAVVVTRQNAAELRAALHADTATWKIPKKWVVVPALPLTARGKTDTRTLQAMLT